MTLTTTPPLRWPLARCAALAAGLFIGAAAMASEPMPSGPFRIDEISLSVHMQPGHGLPVRRLNLVGAGDSALETGGKSQGFAYPAADLLAAVNVLQRQRFFQMPEQLGPLRSLAQGPDGRIFTQLVMMSDTGTTTVCVGLAAYRKCVSYQQDAPPELEALVSRLMGDAQRRGSAPTGK